MVQNAVFVIVRAEDIIQLLSGQHSNDDMDLSFADAYCTSVLDACTFPDLPCESATSLVGCESSAGRAMDPWLVIITHACLTSKRGNTASLSPGTRTALASLLQRARSLQRLFDAASFALMSICQGLGIQLRSCSRSAEWEVALSDQACITKTDVKAMLHRTPVMKCCAPERA